MPEIKFKTFINETDATIEKWLEDVFATEVLAMNSDYVEEKDTSGNYYSDYNKVILVVKTSKIRR